MGRTSKNINIEGQYASRVLGKFRIIRGFATLQDLAEISAPYEMASATAGTPIQGHQRAIRPEHAEEIKRYRKKLIPSNPFEDVKTGSVANTDRMRFISREDIQKVLDACPDAQWRLIVAMCRYGGLRPGEVLSMTWEHIDWARDRMTVLSEKTEHHEGKDKRVVPIFPELLPYLRQAFEQAEPGVSHVITRYRTSRCNLGTQFKRIIQRAGLTVWPKPFVNLRSTRETELEEKFHGAYFIYKWMGNSRRIADKHYNQVTEEHYKLAVTPKKAAPNPALYVAESNDFGQHLAANEKAGISANALKQSEILVGASSCSEVQNCPMVPTGFEPATFAV